MIHASFEPVLQALERSEAAPTSDMLELASHLGVDVREGWPATVVAAAIEQRLDPILRNRPERDATEAQLEFLRRLRQEAGAAIELPRQFNVASAWIEVLLRRRTGEALASLQLRRGDVVDRRRRHDSSQFGTTVHVSRFQVSSIGDNGLVYFRGGNGQCGWPASLTVVARGGTAAAVDALSVDGFWD